MILVLYHDGSPSRNFPHRFESEAFLPQSVRLRDGKFRGILRITPMSHLGRHKCQQSLAFSSRVTKTSIDTSVHSSRSPARRRSVRASQVRRMAAVTRMDGISQNPFVSSLSTANIYCDVLFHTSHIRLFDPEMYWYTQSLKC